MQTEGEASAAEYLQTLNELDSISKIQINALTMLAEENKEHAFHIAACIENQLRSVPGSRKLPILYLIDSIVKNYPKSNYVRLFTQNIVSNFCNVFEASDERTRRSLHKLRMTWDTTHTFPIRKLTAIDERINELDPNWPIIHRSRRIQQLQQQRQQQQQQQPNQIQSQPEQPPPLMPQPQPVISAPILLPPPPPLMPPSVLQPQPFVQTQTVMQLEQVLQTQTVLQPTQPVMQPQSVIQPQQPQPQFDKQNQPLLALLETLYGGKQCSSCCLRFDNQTKYSMHLDWHFRQNLKNENTFSRRKWYYPLKLWVQFREIADEEDVNNNEDESSNMTPQVIEVETAPAFKDDQKNMCPVCHEAFQKFWAEEEEEWRLRNARLFDDERVYHPLCINDLKSD